MNMVISLKVGEEARELVQPAFMHLQHEKVDEQRVHSAAPPSVASRRGDCIPLGINRVTLTGELGRSPLF